METITQMSSQAQSEVDDKVAELEKAILKWDTHPRNNDQLLKIQNLENDVSKMETSVVSLSQKNQILENNLNQRFRDVNQQVLFVFVLVLPAFYRLLPAFYWFLNQTNYTNSSKVGRYSF